MHDEVGSTGAEKRGKGGGKQGAGSVLVRWAVSSAIIGAVTLTFLVMVEGVSSIVFVARSGQDESILRERAHTEFDAELGWINAPGVRLNDLYGPGLYLRTNAQRFRGDREFTPGVPQGKVRLTCSGDSFTLGYGVGDEDAWCALLQKKDPRLETVNMGQGGYGVDQAYLWYRRDGATLEHNVAVFTFTAVDFGRMMAGTFYGYPKPVLSVRGGKPVLVRPSSRLRFVMRGLGQRWQQLGHLRFVELWRQRQSPAPDAPAMPKEEGRQLVSAIFDDLVQLAAQRHATLLVVLLPILEDYHPSEADEWRDFVSKELAARSVPFADLVSELREEPEGFVPLLFRGHYSELGNRWVGDHVYDALLKAPGVTALLQAASPLVAPIQPLVPADTFVAGHPISLPDAHVEASAIDEEAHLAMDGSRTTRWQSGAFQEGHEELRIDLGTSFSVRQVRLELGQWPYDFARGLALDVGEDPAHLTEVFRARRGEQALVDNLDGTGPVQLLTLRSAVQARYLRIRQTGAARGNFWSVAEIEVFGEK